MFVLLDLHLLGLRQQGFDLAEVEECVTGVSLLNDARDDVAFAACVLLVLHLALRLADALEDHLLRGLRRDTAEVVRSVVPLASDVALFVELLRDHLDRAGLHVDLDQSFLGRGGHALVRGEQSVRERLQHDLDGDALLALDVLERLHHLGIHLRATFFAPHSKTVRAWATSV